MVSSASERATSRRYDRSAPGRRPNASLMLAPIDCTDRRIWLTCNSRRREPSMSLLTSSAARSAASRTSRSRCAMPQSAAAAHAQRNRNATSLIISSRPLLAPPLAPLCRRLAFRAVWHLAPSDISRRLAFGAVWHFAPSGISRRPAFGAVWHFAPSGIWRRLAFGAVWHLAPFGISRRLRPWLARYGTTGIVMCDGCAGDAYTRCVAFT